MIQNDMITLNRDIHCPYCAQTKGYENNHNAILINKHDGRQWSLGLPFRGLKNLLGIYYLNFFWIFRYGFKMYELSRINKNTTYVFCPVCGNVVSANAPEEVKAEGEEAKLYRTYRNKCIGGLSQGIADFLDISAMWVKFMNWIIILSGIYILLAMHIPFEEDIEKGVRTGNKPFVKAVRGKWFLGICKGISNKYEISIVYLRIVFGIIAFTIIPGIIYLIYGLRCKRKEDDNG